MHFQGGYAWTDRVRLQVRCEARKWGLPLGAIISVFIQMALRSASSRSPEVRVQSRAVISTLRQSSPPSLHSFYKNPRLPNGVESKTILLPLIASISASISAGSVELAIQIFFHWR